MPVGAPSDERIQEHPDHRGSRTRGAVDPWAFVVGAVALACYVARGIGGILDRDLGVYSYGAQRVLAGVPPYLGIENRAGPLAHMVPVPGIVAARLVGGDDLTGMRIWYLVLGVAGVVLAYLVVRDVFSSRVAGLTAAATLLAFEGFTVLATTGPREKTPMVLFMWCAIWALTHRRWLLTGVFVALTTLTLQTGFFPVAASAVVGLVLLCHGRERLTATGRFVLGGALPTVVIALYYALTTHVSVLLSGLVVLNVKYSSGRPLSSRAGVVWPKLQDGYGVSIWLLVGGLLSLLVLAVVRLADRGRRRDPLTALLVALAVGALAGLAWTEKDFDSWVDAFPLLPYAAIGVAALVHELRARLPDRAGYVVAALLIVVPTVSGARFAVTTRDDPLAQQRTMIEVLGREVHDPTIWSVEAPQVLVLAGTVNPTRYQMVSEGLQRHIAAVWPGGFDGWVQSNLARRPDFIAIKKHTFDVGTFWRDKIGQDYIRIAVTPGVVVFARRSLSKAVIHRLRQAEKPYTPYNPIP
jgi:hypothetical protein